MEKDDKKEKEYFCVYEKEYDFVEKFGICCTLVPMCELAEQTETTHTRRCYQTCRHEQCGNFKMLDFHKSYSFDCLV